MRLDDFNVSSIKTAIGYYSTLLETTDLREDLRISQFRGITIGVGPIWGTNSLSFIVSWGLVGAFLHTN